MRSAYELKAVMRDHAGGTAKYHRNWCNKRFIYTDGIMAVARAAGAFWLLDVLATEVVPGLLKLWDEHGVNANYLKLSVTDNVGTLSVNDYSKHLTYTDFPDGEWLFYMMVDQVVEPGFTNIVMCLPEED